MLDLKHYARTHLPEDEVGTFLRFFGRYRIKSINHAVAAFGSVDLSWVEKEDLKNTLASITQRFSDALKENERVSFSDKLDYIYQAGFLTHEALPELEFKAGRNVHGGICPACGKKELFIPKKGTVETLICNRKDKCGYISNIITYMKEYRDMTAGEALSHLSDLAGVDLAAYEQSREKHIDGTVDEAKIQKAKSKVVNPGISHQSKTEYFRFDREKKFVQVDYRDFLKVYDNLSDRQKFMMVVTAIYDFSKQTDQAGKEEYYASRGLDKEIHPVLESKIDLIHRDLGWIPKKKLPELVSFLKDKFPKKDLVEFGVITPDDHRHPGEFKHVTKKGFAVIPSYDLYSNMITGLKLRNAKLADWQSSNMKEPELSYGRIANPLPYSVTRESMLDKRIIFRFFEGTVDAFSMPLSKDALYCDVGIPGTNGISEEMLGYFMGRKVEIWFDADTAGQEGIEKLAEKLRKAGALPIIKRWDKRLGEDINEILVNGNISKL